MISSACSNKSMFPALLFTWENLGICMEENVPATTQCIQQKSALTDLPAYQKSTRSAFRKCSFSRRDFFFTLCSDEYLEEWLEIPLFSEKELRAVENLRGVSKERKKSWARTEKLHNNLGRTLLSIGSSSSSLHSPIITSNQSVSLFRNYRQFSPAAAAVSSPFSARFFPSELTNPPVISLNLASFHYSNKKETNEPLANKKKRRRGNERDIKSQVVREPPFLVRLLFPFSDRNNSPLFLLFLPLPHFSTLPPPPLLSSIRLAFCHHGWSKPTNPLLAQQPQTVLARCTKQPTPFWLG